LATLELQHKSQADPDLDWFDYISQGQGYIDLVNGNVRAARVELEACTNEYRAACLTWQEFRDAMEQEIQGVCYSLELSRLHQQALEAEFVYRHIYPVSGELETPGGNSQTEKRPLVELKTKGIQPSRSTTNPAAGARVRQYRLGQKLTQEKFALKAHITARTLRTLEKTGEASDSTWAEVAHAMGIGVEELLRS